MTELTEGQIQSKISHLEERIEKKERYFNEGEIPSDRRPIAYYGSGTDAQALGLYRGFLGNLAQAREWFKKAANYYIQSIRERRKHRHEIEKSYWENEPYVLLDALYAAILSGDKNVREIASRETLSVDPTYEQEFPGTTPWYYFARTLASLIINDREQALIDFDHLQTACKGLDTKFERFFRGLTTVAEGFLYEDGQLIAEGTGVLIKHHLQNIQGTPTGIDEEICYHATALAHLAQERGLTDKFESEYIFEALL